MTFSLVALFSTTTYYVSVDPFMTIWHYDNYNAVCGAKSCPNAAFQRVKILQENDSTNFDSFILGSSRVVAYRHTDWKRFIGENSRCFTFYQSDGNLLGLQQRLNYICQHYTLKNCLLILDIEAISNIMPQKGALYMEPWQCADYPYIAFVQFHYNLINDFYTIKYQQQLLQRQPFYTPLLRQSNNLTTGEWAMDEADSLISSFGYDSYLNRLPVNPFQKRSPYISNPILTANHLIILDRIKNELQSCGTEYKIVIGPLYNQIKLNPNDLLILKEYFGYGNVFDFSGVNEFTDDISNYYENSHYRPNVGKKIMEYIYN